jgi:hypothetical protein
MAKVEGIQRIPIFTFLKGKFHAPVIAYPLRISDTQFSKGSQNLKLQPAA